MNGSKIAKMFSVAMAIGVVMLGSGCLTSQRANRRAMETPAATKPVVAVAGFENQAGFSGKWNLGEGMAEMLMTALIESGEVVVLERQELNSVIEEILLQGKSLFRKEGRVKAGRLKNAQYLIVGAITDFTVTDDASGWFSVANLRTWGRGSRSKVALHLRVSEVESGEILDSVKGVASAYAGWFKTDVDYKEYSFGGSAFSRTPLGKATEKAVDEAVEEILEVLPDNGNHLRIADADEDTAIINAGTNAGIEKGDIFIVREKGREITDPVTGDVIDTIPGKVRGRIEVYQVNSGSAYARYNEGTAKRGDLLSRE